MTDSVAVSPLRTAASARPRLGVETLALLASVFFSLLSNGVVWRHVLADRSLADVATWWLLGCLFVALTAFHFVLLSLVLTRRNARWLLGALLLIGAFASHFIEAFNVFLDPSMLRSVLATNVKEARELLTWPLAWHVAWQALLPIWLLGRVEIVAQPWRRAALRRALALGAAAALFAAALFANFQETAGIARNHREWRFLVTPSNVVYSLIRVASAAPRSAELQPIAPDARLDASWAGRSKPVLFVIVVGETARAANWGLDGYARQTTPELARLDVVNFSDVTSCGTNTEVSVPCMFSPWGRHDYDEARIRDHQSLLHVLDRVRLPVLWRDNQSGCKGVCSGLETDTLDSATTPGLCADGRCFDEILLHGLDRRLAERPGNRVVVLHTMGSHGPAYYRRYPDAFKRFGPTCDTDELRKCSPEQIVNGYDNSILYTDHVIAQAIGWLREREKDYDSALVYVSDHGESLGEHSLFLHGMPWLVAPDEQTHVPMVMWLSPGYASSFGIDTECLRRRAAQPASQDNLFHTVLGMLDVRTGVYDADYDLTRSCRTPPQ